MDNNPQPEPNNQVPNVAPPQQFASTEPSAAPITPSSPPQQPAQPYALTSNVSPDQPAAQPPTSSGLIVLQWLTYAFWGWTVLAMSILTTTVLANLISNADTGGFMPYGIAAVLVLLPIAIVCDVFYSKQEPAKKAGAASLVMIIHAVIFALFGIGALIGIVISLVTMFTSSGDSSNQQVALLSTMIVTVLYAATFMRTINPQKTPWVRRFFPIFMAVVVGIISIMAIVGPVANARLTRTDRLITENLSDVQRGVSNYYTENNKLPEDLDSIGLKGDAKQLVDDNLVIYKPDTKPATTETDRYSSTYYSSSSTSTANAKTTKTSYYQLCATYKKSNERNGNSYESSSRNSNEYQSYVSAYTHPEGEVCYKLKTSPY